MAIYETAFEIEVKSDHSPVTQADRVVNDLLMEKIQMRYPQSEFITEESVNAPYETRKDWESFWLIDPLDGTKEFIKRNGEFTINVALIEFGIPVFGIVYAPAARQLFYGLKGRGSFEFLDGRSQILPRERTEFQKIKTVALSRSHLNERTLQFLKEFHNLSPIREVYSGSSLKMCMVASGEADIYPRFGPTMEWDTAAAHAVVMYAGKEIREVGTGLPLRYNKPDLRNPDFIAQ